MSADAVDLRRRRFLTAAVTAVGGVGAAFAAVPFVASFQPSERAKAIGAPVEVDIGRLEPGQMATVKWRGQPVWVVRRSEEALATLELVEGQLRDPGSSAPQQPDYARNVHRSRNPEFLVLVGICTHLGCSPGYFRPSEASHLGPNWHGGFFCACHGSMFDLAGRVYRAVPAPTNLVVPPHAYLTERRIIIGVDELETA
jgi:ubiquinol-cytochrome c reductase iron-sulfur subunit